MTPITDGGTTLENYAYTRAATANDPANNPGLRTRYSYNAAGWVQNTTDPRALVTRTLYDMLGRTTSVIEAYTDGNPTNTNNRTTAFTYDGDNNLLTYTAVLPGSVQQQTVYSYVVTGSVINSNDLLSSVTYPGQQQTESYTYNALSQVASLTDRNATVHSYSYDVLGRQTKDAATTLGQGVDPAVQRLETAYDTGGRPYLFTSYSASSGGTLVNQVQRAFNGLGQITNEYQSHSGAVNTGSTPQVQYAYSVMTGGANHSRLISMTYPNTSPVRTLTYNYNGTTLDDSISRLTSIIDGGTTLENYAYLGLDTVVKRGHPEPGVDLTYIQQITDSGTGDGGDQYRGLDRFGRVVDQRWIPTSSPQSPTDRFQYSYDQDSNRLARTNAVNTNLSETYTYDNFNQLTNFTRGSHSQGWTLDPLGNWTQFTNDTTTQSRGHNTQNQITSFNGNPVQWYDANGNTTTDERGNTYKYDAWDRLAQAVSPTLGTATYSYDALGHRVTETRPVQSVPTTTDLYYSSSWQVIEERSGGNVTQYVWSPVYVDALIERDNGGQRLYVQQDANLNVTAVVGYDAQSMTWKVQERYIYDPYGQPSVLAPDWSARASSLFGWIYLHQGGRLDSTSGIYSFRERDYSPTLGRWMEEDPIQYSGEDSNLYGYVQSQPTGLTDPLGLRPWWLIYRDPPLSGGLPSPRKPNGPPRPRDPIDPPYVPGSCWADMRTAYFDPSFNDNWKEGMGQVKVLAEVGANWDASAGMWVTSSAGSKLVRALDTAGRPVAKGLERGHHIVAKAAKAAGPARKKLASLGIDIDDAFNGIGLPKKFHEHLHTKEYYEWVNLESKDWNTKGQAIEGLKKIAKKLLEWAE